MFRFHSRSTRAEAAPEEGIASKGAGRVEQREAAAIQTNRVASRFAESAFTSKGREPLNTQERPRITPQAEGEPKRQSARVSPAKGPFDFSAAR